jgi:hypothetical protein
VLSKRATSHWLSLSPDRRYTLPAVLAIRYITSSSFLVTGLCKYVDSSTSGLRIMIASA